MVEHERSYVFTYSGIDLFIQYCKSIGIEIDESLTKYLEDYYLEDGIRIRKETKRGVVTYIFTKKTGNKADGFRFEFEEKISPELAESLIGGCLLCVKKTRKNINVGGNHYSVTIDFLDQPMKLAVLEIEALHPIVFPIPIDIPEKLFKLHLKECPLSSFSMFKRHIAISGGPSSGKSETSKILSHKLNTEFQANSFHVAEFATTFIQKYKKTPNFWEEFFIWHGQHEREHSASQANIVISDCPTFLTYIYLLHLPKDKFSDSTALVLAKMYKRVLFDIKWYSDILFLNLQEYKENGIRYQSKEEALVIEAKIRQFLTDHNIVYSSYICTQVDTIISDLFYLNHPNP